MVRSRCLEHRSFSCTTGVATGCKEQSCPNCVPRAGGIRVKWKFEMLKFHIGMDGRQTKTHVGYYIPSGCKLRPVRHGTQEAGAVDLQNIWLSPFPGLAS